MATPPVFSAGAVLTAAQMNAVGLWLVKTETIGNAVSSVTVSNAFNADFDNYLILAFGGSCTTSSNVRLQLGSVTTGYYGFMSYGQPAAATVLGSNDNNTALFNHVGGADSLSIHVKAELQGPYLTKATEIQSYARYGTVYGNYVGVNDSTTSHTAFTISVAAGTMTGGTIRVYGYRN